MRCFLYNFYSLVYGLAILLWSATSLYAQQRANLASVVPEQVWADNVSYSDGYNLSSIYNFCTDRQGKVWAAGQSGVANFSGALMQYYFPGDPVNKKGLNDGPFYAVVMDAQQRIWVSGNSGLYWFDEVRDSFCLVSNPEGGAWQPGRRLIVADKSGQFLWLADQSGLYRFAIKDFHWQAQGLELAFEPIVLLETASGKILLSSDNSTLLYDPVRNTINRRYDHAKAAFETPDGAIWLGTWRDGLKRIDPITLDMDIFFPPGKHKSGVYGETFISLSMAPALTGDSLLWCGTSENGVFFFDIYQKKFVGNLNWDERRSSGLLGYSVAAMYCDPMGILWMDNNGISRITPHRQHLLASRIIGLRTDDSKQFYVNGLVQDRYRPDYQWLAISYYGLASYNKAKKELERWWYYPPGAPVLKRERNYRPRISYDRKGNLWASTETGFLILDKNSNVQTVSIPKYNNANTAVNQFVFDQHNVCWMATELGLCAYDRVKGKIDTFSTGTGAPDNNMTDLVEVPDGLWLASAQGIHFFKFATKQFSTYRFPQAGAASKPVNFFYSIIHGQDGAVFAMNGIGLVCLNQGELKQVCEIPYAYYGHTQSMCMDNSGFIWISAFNKLHKVDPRTGQVAGPFFAEGGYFQEMKDMQLKLASGNTILTIDPDQLTAYTHTQKAVFTQVKVYDKRLSVSLDSAAIRPVQLNYQQDALTFEYDCPDFTSFLETTFEVFLEGYDKSWVPQGKKRSITYTNLSPGDYTFQVRVSNLAGRQHPEITIFRFSIAPPFWQTAWFRALAVALISFILYMIFRTRVNAIRSAAARKTEFYQL